MVKYTPMMEQYLEIKKEYEDCILFYRLGDFYEMFFDDAITCSKELELTLTGKSCGTPERAPMCGVPFHSAGSYIDKLVNKGYKVAICEQVEDPKQTKGIVKREVIRVVTPGTNINDNTLDETKNRYIMSIVYLSDSFGLSICDVSTGDYFVTEQDDINSVLDEINKFMPVEIICNDAFYVSGADIDDFKDRLGITVSSLPGWYYEDNMAKKTIFEHFGITSLNALGLETYDCGISAAGGLLIYLLETQKNSLSHIKTLKPYTSSDYMFLDRATRRNLELTETLREKNKKGSLLWVLDKTKTAMGARCLRNYVEQPLINSKEINRRLDAVSEFVSEMFIREELREYLGPIYDLERLITRVSYKTINPRDMIALKTSLSMLPYIKEILSDMNSYLIKKYVKEFDVLSDVYSWIDSAITEEPAMSMRDGGIIKEGYNEEVDHLRAAKTDGKKWLAELEEKERNNTGIKNLKIKYNRVFGYYFEVTNSYKELVPETWIRKQTLSNAERYMTPELKEIEDAVLGAEDRLNNLEYELFQQLRDMIYEQMARIQNVATIIAYFDVYSTLAVIAERNRYVRPIVNDRGKIDIKSGRHPVIEQITSEYLFVENDTHLDNKDNRLLIITGPNMAGKSTYMRQTALIVLMAQIGSFVPAEYAEIGICDRIFTRVGASDDLAQGQSTFMVEMTEVANILRNATKKSLIILDEIGRGTSTYDGLAIAWSVAEHISNPKLIGAKTLFATHYHELTELEGKLPGVKNYCIAVKEQGEDIVFLRKIVRGGADRSYGVLVARLAGVPENVLKRADEILVELINKDSGNRPLPKEKVEEEISGLTSQISIFDIINKTEGFDDILLEIHDIDINTLSPLDALNMIHNYQTRLKEKF